MTSDKQRCVQSGLDQGVLQEQIDKARQHIRTDTSISMQRRLNFEMSVFERNVSIEHVEHGMLLGCARKYIALINRQSGDSIVSFSYFQNVIEEARESKMPAEYWRYLQMLLDRRTAVDLDESCGGGEVRSFMTESKGTAVGRWSV